MVETSVLGVSMFGLIFGKAWQPRSTCQRAPTRESRHGFSSLETKVAVMFVCQMILLISYPGVTKFCGMHTTDLQRAVLGRGGLSTRLSLSIKPYSHEAEVTEKFKTMQEMMNVLYKCEDAQGVVRACLARFSMGTGWQEGCSLPSSAGSVGFTTPLDGYPC